MRAAYVQFTVSRSGLKVPGIECYDSHDTKSQDPPREPNTPLIKEYTLNYQGVHILI